MTEPWLDQVLMDSAYKSVMLPYISLELEVSFFPNYQINHDKSMFKAEDIVQP